MQDLTEQYKSEAGKDANRPIELYDLYLGSQNSCDAETYYFSTDNRRVYFWNPDSVLQYYQPIKVTRSAIPASNQLEIEAVSGEFDNVDRLWSNWLNTVDLRGKRVVVRKVFLDLLNDQTHAKVMFDGIINAVSELTELSVKLECKSKLKSLSLETGRLQQLYCNYIFGDEFCQMDVSTTRLNDQVVGEGSTTGEVLDVARTEADDWWNDGIIQFMSGVNQGQKRKVVDYVAGDHKLILDYALPHVPAAGDRYMIERGCDKSFDVCRSRFGNQANFGGFKNIPQLINPMQVEE
jgi:uncharacterized phage protein (TIGR02218 family)